MQFFYHPDLMSHPVFELLPDEARHCLKALRKRAGDEISITDGCGRLATAQILSTEPPARCVVQLLNVDHHHALRPHCFHLAIAPTKNADRIEWLVEKSIEIGVEQISFLRCEHSERTSLDLSRLQRLAVAAIKQSNTCLIPTMQLIDFSDFVSSPAVQSLAHRYIAWCADDLPRVEFTLQPLQGQDALLLIGPEGDFSPAEVQLAHQKGFTAVSLGPRRLRTETAGLYGVCVYAGMQV